MKKHKPARIAQLAKPKPVKRAVKASASARFVTPTSAPAKGEQVKKIPLELLHVSERNTRQPERKDVLELARSLKAGQTTPAIVRPYVGQPGHYEIGAGSRRSVAAAQPEAGPLSTLDCIIRDLCDADFEELILVENLQREDPDPKAEAKLLERYVAQGVRTPEDISGRIGKSRHWVIRRLQLLRIIAPLRKSWESGSIGHFSVEMMEQVGALPEAAQKTLAQNWQFERCGSKADLKEFLQETIACDLSTAPFDLTDPRFFVAGCGPGCATDSNNQAALFDFDKKKECGRCLNTGCFFKRVALFRAVEHAELVAKAGEDLPIVTRNYGGGDIQLGKNTVSATYNYEAKVGKPPEGAKRVIVAERDGTLKLGYIPKPTRTDAATQRKLATPVEKLSLRRDALQCRRWKIVHEKLLAALAASTVKDCTTPDALINLVTIFGLPYHRSPIRDGHSMTWWDLLDRSSKDGFPIYNPSDYSMHDLGTRDEVLWAGLKLVFKDQLGGWYQVGQLLQVVPDMERISDLIAFDLRTEKHAADLQIPPPKTWGSTDPHTLEPLNAAPVGAKKAAKKKVKPA